MDSRTPEHDLAECEARLQQLEFKLETYKREREGLMWALLTMFFSFIALAIVSSIHP